LNGGYRAIFRAAGDGRLCEIGNGRFIEFHCAKAGFGWAAGLEKSDGPFHNPEIQISKKRPLAKMPQQIVLVSHPTPSWAIWRNTKFCEYRAKPRHTLVPVVFATQQHRGCAITLGPRFQKAYYQITEAGHNAIRLSTQYPTHGTVAYPMLPLDGYYLIRFKEL
jgi:hypothetical protein